MRLAGCAASILLVTLPLAGSAGQTLVSLGPCSETHMVGPGERECEQGTLIYHHDGVCDDALCWQYAGIAPPYYGAFGEAYDLGTGIVHCGAFWVTNVGGYVEYPSDLYMWEGGVEDLPGSVMALVAGHIFENVPWWPSCGQNDVPIDLHVSGAFTVGCWADFSDEPCLYFVGRDLNGAPGRPWTNVAPDIGLPSGWQDPNIFWPHTQSIMFGVYFSEGGSPVESSTWGRIKALTR